ncbi:hypothetical protein GCM10009780_06370 [Actinomadura alba]
MFDGKFAQELPDERFSFSQCELGRRFAGKSDYCRCFDSRDEEVTGDPNRLAGEHPVQEEVGDVLGENGGGLELFQPFPQFRW